MKHLMILMICVAGIWGMTMTGQGCDPVDPTDAGTQEETTPTATMSSIETTIFADSCALSSCHGGGAGNLTLGPGKSHGNLVNKASANEPDQKLVIPGDPENSLLYKVLKAQTGSVRRMPTKNPLEEAKIQRIYDWIKNGAKDD